MTRPLRRSLLLLFLLAGAGTLSACLPDETSPAPATRTPSPEPRPAPVPLTDLVLRPFTEQVLTLAWNGSYDFLVAAAPDQYIELVAMQEGVDVVLELYRPDNTLETRVDSPNRRQGPEPLPLIGSAKGPYKLTLRGGDRSPIVGQVRLQVRAARPPTDRDRMRVEAEREFAIGEETRRGRGSHSLAEAPQHYERALALTRRVEDERREADVLLGLGRLHAENEQNERAVETIQFALSRYETQHRQLEITLSKNHLGSLFAKMDQTQKAIPLLLTAKQGFRLLRVDDDEALTRYALCLAYREVGKIELAHAECKAAEKIFEQMPDLSSQGMVLIAVGKMQTDRGLFAAAEDTLIQAKDLVERSGSSRHQATASAALGWVKFLAGKTSEGLDLFERALKAEDASGSKREQAVLRHDVAVALEVSGNLEAAERHHIEAARIFREIGSREGEAISLAHSAHVTLKQGHLNEARRSFEASIALTDPGSSPLARASGHYGLALVLTMQGDLKNAASSMNTALQAYDELRRESLRPTFRMASFAFQHPSYTRYVDLLMNLHREHPDGDYERRGFEAVERARARNLLDDLLMAPWLLRKANGTWFHEREMRIGSAITQAATTRERNLASGESGTNTARANSRELRALLGELDQLEAELRSGHPEFKRLEEVQPLTLSQVQASLDGDTVLLEYALGDDRSYLWAITREATTSFVLPARKELEQRAVAVHSALSTQWNPLSGNETRLQLTSLSRLLLEGVGPLLTRRRLLISPDGDLVLVPFAALLTPQKLSASSDETVSRSLPLGLAHEISYTPSASAAALLRKRKTFRPPQPYSLAAIGDPTYAHPSERLPFLGSELSTLRSLFTDGPTFVASGTQASKVLVKRMDLSPYRILHFASHATFDPEFPELSAIILSTLDETGASKDGSLRGFELRGLHLESDLVVISGCSTGRGKTIRGEGAVGLVNSLLSAGSQQVLVSLWEVEDRATAELMKQFYRALITDGLSPEAALAHSQKSIAQTPGWENPYYWSGFLLTGASSSSMEWTPN